MISLIVVKSIKALPITEHTYKIIAKVKKLYVIKIKNIQILKRKTNL